MNEAAVTKLLKQHTSIRRILLHSEFFETLRSFQTELNLTKKQLRGILSDSMALRMLQPNIPNLVDTLKSLMGDPFNLTRQQLVTLVGNGSVATRIESDKFIETLKSLMGGPFNLTAQQLVTLVGNNSVATRIESDDFLNALKTILEHNGNNNQQMIIYAKKNVRTILEN